MKLRGLLCLVCGLLFLTARQSPAPIQEESPTPSPKPSVKPGPARKEATHAASATPSPRATDCAQFDGTWTGTYKRGWAGMLQHTYVISGHGTLLRETMGSSETYVWPATCKGATMRWSWSINVSGNSTLTLARDGRSAVFTVKATGFGGYETSTIFHKISP